MSCSLAVPDISTMANLTQDVEGARWLVQESILRTESSVVDLTTSQNAVTGARLMAKAQEWRVDVCGCRCSGVIAQNGVLSWPHVSSDYSRVQGKAPRHRAMKGDSNIKSST